MVALSSSSQCLNDTLIISTAYNPVTGSVIPGTGVADPKWTIASTTNTPTAPAPGNPAIVVNPTTLFGFAMQPSSNWITFAPLPTSAYPTSNVISPYDIVLARVFQICYADSITLLMSSMSRDNWIQSIAIDGITVWTYPNPTGAASNFTTFMSNTFVPLGYLSAGSHTLSYQMRNESINHGSNFHGLNMSAVLLSTIPTLVLETASCIGFSCFSSSSVTA